MRVAVVLDTFPKLSESFILNQIVSLLEHNIFVHIYAARPPLPNEPVNELFAKYNLGSLTSYEPIQPRGPWLRRYRHVMHFLLLLFKSPLTFLRLICFDGLYFNRQYLYASWPLLNKHQFDVVHAHFGPIGIKVCNLQKLGFLRAPIICSFHGYDVDRNDFRSNPAIYSLLFNQAKLVTGNSLYTVGNIEKLGCPREKLKVLPESLFTSYFAPNDQRKSTGNIQILTVARLVEFKGIEWSLRSIAELMRRDIKNFKYTIVGDGPLKDELVRLCVDLGVDNYVCFLGARSQEFIIRTMNESDIFLLCGIMSSDGRQENQGLVIQEAQAMGLPVVASDTGGVKEGLIAGKTGYLVRQKDVSGFADKLERLINDKGLRERMGQEGRQFVIQNFDSGVLSMKLIQLYRQGAANCL